MELFNKTNKQKLLVAGSVLLLAMVALFIFQNIDAKKQNHISQQSHGLQVLLMRADSGISRAPALAEQSANRLLSLAVAQHNNLYLVRSWILLGKISNLKGLNKEALDFFDKAYAMALQKDFAAEACEALIETGEIFYKKGEYDRSLDWFRRADSAATARGLEQLKAYALYYIGKYNQTEGNFSLAKQYYLRSIAIGRRMKDTRLQALILPSLGKNYISEGNLHLALTSYQEAYFISNQLNDQLLSADICNHLGSLYLQLNEYEKAMAYHRNALVYRQKMNYPDGLAKSYNNIGKVFFEQQQADSANYYFERSLALCQLIQYKKGTVKALHNIGKVYRFKNQAGKASRYLIEALTIAQRAGYDIGEAEASLDLADLHKDAGRYDSAIYYYTVSLNTLLKTNYNETLLQAYHGLYECYDAKKDYKKALAYHVDILNTEKKMLDVENKRQLAILNITFDTERKEKDYQVLLKDNELKESLLKRNNIALWLVAAVLSFTILLCLYIYNRFYSKKKANRLLEELNYKITNQNTEFEHLNRELEHVSREKDKLFSIISHELRNPLYWLQNLSEVLSRKYQQMSPEKMKKSLLSLDESAKNVYHLMDNLLHWSRSELNRVHPRKARYNLQALVTETTQMYDTFLQQKEIAMHNRLPGDVFIYVDSDLFGCVIRNLISNAIKYTPNGGQIAFDCEVGESCVTVVVSDSGRGINSADLETIFSPGPAPISMPGLMQEKGSGLGLKLCKDFVEMNDGKIWVQSRPYEGTQFFFTVPLDTSAKKKQPAQLLETTE